MTFLVLKTLHIIGFVAWFAGLFYLVRMFVYYREAQDRPLAEKEILSAQFLLMQERVYKIICNPAMLLTWICGLVMLHLHGFEWLKLNSWMHIKLFLLVLLSGYTGSCGKMIKDYKKGKLGYSSIKLRMMNEVPTLFLLAIVLLAVFKNTSNTIYVFGAVLLMGFFLFLGIKAYRRSRETNA